MPLGFVEGLNNKIRVFQRRAYGLRDEGYLRLKRKSKTIGGWVRKRRDSRHDVPVQLSATHLIVERFSPEFLETCPRERRIKAASERTPR